MSLGVMDTGSRLKGALSACRCAECAFQPGVGFQHEASPSTVRWSSAVDSTIELACTGVAHKARAALSGLSGQRHGRRCRAFGRSVECGTSAPSDLFQPYVTQMTK